MDRINQEQLDLFESMNFNQHSEVEESDLGYGEEGVIYEEDASEDSR